MAKSSAIRVVLDSNIILASISRHSRYKKVLDLLFEGAFDVYLDNEILLEYEEKITENFDVFTAAEFLAALQILPNVYQVTSYFKLSLITVDPDDNKFCDCAFSANAHCIVSNDRHFQILKQIDFPKIEVLRLDEFLLWIEQKLKQSI